MIAWLAIATSVEKKNFLRLEQHQQKDLVNVVERSETGRALFVLIVKAKMLLDMAMHRDYGTNKKTARAMSKFNDL